MCGNSIRIYLLVDKICIYFAHRRDLSLPAQRRDLYLLAHRRDLYLPAHRRDLYLLAHRRDLYLLVECSMIFYFLTLDEDMNEEPAVLYTVFVFTCLMDACTVPGRVRVAVRLRPRNEEELVADSDFADCVELQPEVVLVPHLFECTRLKERKLISQISLLSCVKNCVIG